MKKKLLNKAGFTLIEMMIAMSIFVVFIGILMQSYTSIIQSQRESNEYRVLYSEARHVFDVISSEVRNRAIYYDQTANYNSAADSLTLISKDGEQKLKFEYDSLNKNLMVIEGESGIPYPLIENQESKGFSVVDFDVLISPALDPYELDNVFADSLQFQPKVTIYAEFEKTKLRSGEPFKLDLQTTISSRLYNASPKK